MTKQEHLTEGFQFFAQHKYEEAEACFRAALELDDRFEAAYSALSETLNRKGDIDGAILLVRKWIEINKHDPLAHTALSRLYVQKGMIEEAEKEMAISNFLAQQG